MILVDAGPLIAAFDNSDDRHRECPVLLQNADGELLVRSWFVAEVCYVIRCARFGAAVEAMFLRSFAMAA